MPHATQNPPAVATATTQRIHAATRAAVLELGLRRTTLSEVARRAGVSRMSIYRRYPDVTALLREVMTAEFGGQLVGTDARAAGSDARTRMVRGIAAFVRELRASPLFVKVVADEPELLVPYVVERMGGTQRIAIAMVERGIAEGQADGSVRAGDARAMAQAVLLVAQSFALSAGIAHDVEADRVLEELGLVLDRMLAP
jgi:AcrR family transcriptional regulator